jgi:hypothetical protein
VNNLTHRFGRLLISLGLVATLGLSAAGPAFAVADTGVTVTAGSLTGGGLTFSNFSSVQLDGTAKTTTATWSIANITDARGSGAGWKDSLTLTQLAEHNGTIYVFSGHTIPTSSIKVTTAPVVSQADLTSSPAITVTPVANDTALDTGSAVKLLSASLLGGMGSYSFSNMTSTLTVRANTYAATYKSDATVSLTSGP